MKRFRFKRKWLGRITLTVLLALLLLKLWMGSCHLLVCGLFVGLMVAYIILSDYGSD
ncbi:MAG: hypothetical protein L3J66_01455 [Bacteroidales bacterium]|nr:hypothetical protein [Bacteroidales bacterium]